MKKYIKALFILSFLLLGLVRAEIVLDTNGEAVTPFDEYYIMPYYFSLGGGLSLADTSNKTCPVDVIKEISEVEHGMSLKIIPAFLKIGIVLTNIELRILFADTPECAQSSSDWILVKEDEKWFVGIGGSENHPGREIMEGWFAIEKYGNKGYKLKFCSNSSAAVCGDIGIDVDENQNWRVSFDDEGAYRVVFRKASESSEPEPETPHILEITE